MKKILLFILVCCFGISLSFGQGSANLTINITIPIVRNVSWNPISLAFTPATNTIGTAVAVTGTSTLDVKNNTTEATHLVSLKLNAATTGISKVEASAATPVKVSGSSGSLSFTGTKSAGTMVEVGTTSDTWFAVPAQCEWTSVFSFQMTWTAEAATGTSVVIVATID
jgi:hypothetical protein